MSGQIIERGWRKPIETDETHSQAWKHPRRPAAAPNACSAEARFRDRPTCHGKCRSFVKSVMCRGSHQGPMVGGEQCIRASQWRTLQLERRATERPGFPKTLGSFLGTLSPRETRQPLISLKFLACEGIRLRWNLISRIKILESLQQLRMHQQKTFLRLMWGIRARDSGR
jgi:hypothetical protein